LKVFIEKSSPIVIATAMKKARVKIALYPPSFVIRVTAISGDSIHAIFITVRYRPLVLPIVSGSPKCSMNISIQKNTRVFVMVNNINEDPMIYGLLLVISPASDNMFTNRKMRVSFLLPKFFSILELFVRRMRVMSEAIVYRIPIKLSFIIPVRKMELI